MESLQTFFAAQTNQDIHTLGRYIEQHVNQHWDTIFHAVHEDLIALYPEIGESVYGVYGKHLFQHVHDEMKANGLRATPRLPGGLSISREWGPDDRDRQRWMWSKITTSENAPVGTIVTVFWHDHVQIRIPRAPQVIALTETTKGDVIRALSARSQEFSVALEAREEYAAYLEAEKNASGEGQPSGAEQ